MTEEGLLIGFLILVIAVAIGSAIRGARIAMYGSNYESESEEEDC